MGTESFGTKVSFKKKTALGKNVLILLLYSYPMASTEELTENSDNCAICWEKMESARKLPCSHLFHK